MSFPHIRLRIQHRTLIVNIIFSVLNIESHRHIQQLPMQSLGKTDQDYGSTSDVVHKRYVIPDARHKSCARSQTISSAGYIPYIPQRIKIPMFICKERFSLKETASEWATMSHVKDRGVAQSYPFSSSNYAALNSLLVVPALPF